MEFKEIKEKSTKYLFQNYGRTDLCFTHGKGAYLYDTDGKEYLDMVAGIAVNSVGYAHPKWVDAVSKQAAALQHTSNLYYVEKQAELAEKISTITPKGMTRTLFVNSGAEANEGAMKLAVRNTGRKVILSALNSFHGRTAASLGATGQTKYQDSFESLISDNFRYFDFGDEESLKNKIDKDTAAVLLEPIQGEGGVRTSTKSFFKAVRDICTDNGTMMIMDEVQTGMGRTGKWFGIQHYDVVPDMMTLAKGLGGGVPIGAVVSTDDISKTMTPGTHGTTFGGNPLVCAAGSAVIDIMKNEKLVENAKKLGDSLISSIEKIDSSEIVQARGKGLLIGIEMKSGSKEFQDHAMKNNMLVNICHGNVLRLMPPLIIGEKEKDAFMKLFTEFLS